MRRPTNIVGKLPIKQRANPSTTYKPYYHINEDRHRSVSGSCRGLVTMDLDGVDSFLIQRVRNEYYVRKAKPHAESISYMLYPAKTSVGMGLGLSESKG